MHVLRIGFSNHPEGDRDVTVYTPAETIFVWVEDVDMVAWDPDILFTFVLTQRDPSGNVLHRQTAELAPDDRQAFYGQMPLERFSPGVVQVDIVGSARGAVVLYRSSWLNVYQSIGQP